MALCQACLSPGAVFVRLMRGLFTLLLVLLSLIRFLFRWLPGPGLFVGEPTGGAGPTVQPSTNLTRKALAGLLMTTPSTTIRQAQPRRTWVHLLGSVMTPELREGNLKPAGNGCGYVTRLGASHLPFWASDFFLWKDQVPTLVA